MLVCLQLMGIALLTLCPAEAFAVKADPTPATMRQSDGTTITVVLHGDEDFSWYTTTDGVLLARAGSDFVIGRIDENGQLQATTQLAHEAFQRSNAEVTLIQAQDRDRFYQKASQLRSSSERRRIGIGTASIPYFPHTGSPKAMVILVQFSDTTFVSSDPKKTFNEYFNAEGALTNYGTFEQRNTGSVRQYFSDISEGQFTPQFDVFGPVTLPKASAYYGEGEKDQSSRIQEMIQEACAAIDDTVDFSQYDADGDGNVDLVYVLYAGFSESIAGNSTDCIWPKSGTTTGGTYDGVTVRRYGVSNELNYRPNYPFTKNKEYTKRIMGIGLFVHEFSHTLGLPDVYPTNTSAQIDNQAMEYWDVMDGGEYTDNGYTPTPYTPWEREVMGWIEIEELKDTCQMELMPLNAGGKAYKVTSDNEDEYLILENIQNTGWAKSVLGHGLLVHHIDYPRSSVNLNDYPNNTAGKPGITLVPADGLIISSYCVYTTKADSSAAKPHSYNDYMYSHYGDPFPGVEFYTYLDEETNTQKLGSRSLGIDSLVTVKLNNGTLNKPLYHITEVAKESEGTNAVTFDFLRDFSTDTGITQLRSETTDQDRRIYSIDGRFLGTDEHQLPQGIYIKNKKKILIH